MRHHLIQNPHLDQYLEHRFQRRWWGRGSSCRHPQHLPDTSTTLFNYRRSNRHSPTKLDCQRPTNQRRPRREADCHPQSVEFRKTADCHPSLMCRLMNHRVSTLPQTNPFSFLYAYWVFLLLVYQTAFCVDGVIIDFSLFLGPGSRFNIPLLILI